MWMNWTERVSIRLRVTLLVSLLLLAMSVLFAGFSIASSRRHFAAEPLGASMVAIYQPMWEQLELTNITPALPTESVSCAPAGEMVDIVTGEVLAGEVQAVASTVVQAAQKSFGSEQILALLFINVLGIAMTYWVLGRALRPLTRLSYAMENIHEHNLDKRLPTAESKDEIGSLTDSCNGMLERLRRSFEVQRNFAANAAHELKTPLTVMKSSLQVLHLEEEPPLEDYRETSEVCAETVEQMITLVDELLRLGSVQTEDRTRLELSALVAQALKGQEKEIAALKLQVATDCPLIYWESSASLLFCIVDNLISNAVKYNRPGGTLDVSLVQTEGSLSLSVADSGIGIPQEAISDIFESFYRVDPSRSKKTRGNGLGLALVKTATEHLGGSIVVESQVGKGTRFQITFPI